MTLNEWLCRNFETNDDGNVTVGTVFETIVEKIMDHPELIFLTTFSWFFGLMIEILIIVPQTELTIFSLIILFIILPIIYGYGSLLSLYIIYLILKFVCNIKLAKCRLK